MEQTTEQQDAMYDRLCMLMHEYGYAHGLEVELGHSNDCLWIRYDKHATTIYSTFTPMLIQEFNLMIADVGCCLRENE